MDRAQTSAAEQAVRGPGDSRAPRLAPIESDRRLEDWITSRLEGKPTRPRPSAWSIQRAPEVVGGPDHLRRGAAQGGGTRPGWKRIKIETIGDAVVAAPIDSRLLGEVTLAELRTELLQVCTVARGRLVLNLARVDRVSSQFLELLITLDRQCKQSPGGTLKLCKVGPGPGRLLEISGLDRRFEIYPDTSRALAGPWPSTPMGVHVEILAELGRRSAPPTRGGEAIDPSPAVDCLEAGPAVGSTLLIRTNGCEPRIVAIPDAGLRIGRDSPCEVRLRDPAVSRVHAWVGPRGGRITIEDLGSTNGTSISGRTIRAEAVGIRDGSTFSIGSSRFELSDGSGPIVAGILDEWSSESDCPDSPASSTTPDIPGSCHAPEAAPHIDGDPGPIRCEEIEGVLVLTPTIPRLDDESAIDPIRDRIEALVRGTGRAPRIVFNLAPIASLSGRGIGLLLSQQLRLQREGGEVRLAQATAAVATAMEIVGLPTLIGTFPTIDDAVLTRWPE